MLVLQRTAGTGGKCVYRLDQRWVKNNRDLENIVFSTVLYEYDLFIYDNASFLLTMAFADKALWGYDFVDVSTMFLHFNCKKLKANDYIKHTLLKIFVLG